MRFEHTVVNPEATASYDMLYGGTRFLANATGDAYEGYLEFDEVAALHPDTYEGKAATPAMVASAHGSRFLPCGYHPTYLTATKKTVLERLAGSEGMEQVLSAIADESWKSGAYLVFAFENLLACRGCRFVDEVSGNYALADPARWRETLTLLRSLHASGKLLFREQELAMEESARAHLGKDAAVAEVSSHTLRRLIEGEGGKRFAFMPQPVAGVALNGYFGMISRRSRYPEECLRLVKFILRPDNQREMLRRRIAAPVDASALAEKGFGAAAEQMRKGSARFLVPTSRSLADLIMQAVFWDLSAYVAGRDESGDPLAKLSAKIAHLMSLQDA